jgi:predicted nucleotidyltransferase
MNLGILHQMADVLRQQYGARRVLLFGSFGRGAQTDDSDVDLLVISDTSERFFDRMATVRRLLRPMRKGIPLSPLVLTPEEFERRLAKGDQFLAEIAANGVEL